jgi:hypothetical protein
LRISLTLTVLILEQTVVTAARTGEADVQSIPMAVSVLQGTELARMQDHTVEHVAGRAPGVTFSQNTGRAQVTIRGIDTNAVTPGPIRVRPCISMASNWRTAMLAIFSISTGRALSALLRQTQRGDVCQSATRTLRTPG